MNNNTHPVTSAWSEPEFMPHPMRPTLTALGAAGCVDFDATLEAFTPHSTADQHKCNFARRHKAYKQSIYGTAETIRRLCAYTLWLIRQEVEDLKEEFRETFKREESYL